MIETTDISLGFSIIFKSVQGIWDQKFETHWSNMTSYCRTGNVSILLHMSYSLYGPTTVLCISFMREWKKNWRAHQAIHSFFDSTNVYCSRHWKYNSEENRWKSLSCGTSFWEFWVLLLILSLTHWVTWINHVVFLGLSFPLCETENLERVMSKSLLNLWFYNWLGFSRWPYWFTWNAVPHCHLANTTS